MPHPRVSGRTCQRYGLGAEALPIRSCGLVGPLCTQLVLRQRGEDTIPVPEYLDKAVLTALYPDGLPFDEDNEEPGENAGQEELAMTG